MIEPFILNPFPTLLSFSFFVPTLLRLVLGYITIREGYRALQQKTQAPGMHIVYIVGGVSVLLGLYTQIGALVLLLVTLFKTKQNNVDSAWSERTTLMVVMTLALLVLGGGAFGFDLPF